MSFRVRRIFTPAIAALIAICAVTVPALAAARLERAWAGHGFALVAARPAEAAEIAASGSSWAKRLGAASPDGRRVTRLRLSRLP